MSVEVHQFICLSDNFGLLVRDRETGATASIDAPDGETIDAEAARLGWRLTHLLLTHHHLDHVQGAPFLRARHTGLRIVGAREDAHRLSDVDVWVEEGDTVGVGASLARVLETPGHTSGHLAYHFARDGLAFVGDTLFSLGCGRVFEGTMAQMHASLDKLAALPAETRIYCGHEYTQANARFALTVEPGNPALRERAREVDALRQENRFTLPTTVARELETNPFLRVDEPSVKSALGLETADPVTTFGRLREMKNGFAG
jgi:hydroxyacylglutathione hydrolase